MGVAALGNLIHELEVRLAAAAARAAGFLAATVSWIALCR